MISVKSSGDYRRTRNWLLKNSRGDIFAKLDQFGRLGVDALSKATPVDTGETAHSWDYRIRKPRRGFYEIQWYNTHGDGDTSVAILLQYGHGTKNGGYVQGRDYINPAMKSIFDKMIDDFWKEVKTS